MATLIDYQDLHSFSSSIISLLGLDYIIKQELLNLDKYQYISASPENVWVGSFRPQYML